jgi:S1-C subfamily serine protease
VQVARLGDSDLVRVGRQVFVVGAPLGISHSMTSGYISARRRVTGQLRKLVDTELFQTDAAINQGNSGGPMFDMAGEVIGIVSHLASKTGGSDGIGFAVTSNVVRKTLLESPAFWSGIDGLLLSDDLARVLNVPDGRTGLLVQRVAIGSPGAALGLRDGSHAASIGGEELVLGGDIVLEVQGIRVSADDYANLAGAITAIEDGGELRVLVLRAGGLKTLTMTLARGSREDRG